MMKRPNWGGAMALALTTGVAGMTAAQATTLQITVENLAATGGFSITPTYLAFHDGGFDAFSVGTAATAGLEALAELGDVSGLPSERLAASPGSQAIVAAQSGNGPPTIDPGETSTVQIDVDENLNRFFTFLSMLVPTNDTFLGNGDPEAFALFDATGTFLGDRVIDVTGDDLYDAGTEVNDPANGPAFVVGVDGTLGADEGGTVQQAGDLGLFAGLETPVGVLDGSLIGFGGDPSSFAVARITITEVAVASVPVPAAAWGLLSGVALLGGLRRMRRAA